MKVIQDQKPVIVKNTIFVNSEYNPAEVMLLEYEKSQRKNCKIEYVKSPLINRKGKLFDNCCFIGVNLYLKSGRTFNCKFICSDLYYSRVKNEKNYREKIFLINSDKQNFPNVFELGRCLPEKR